VVRAQGWKRARGVASLCLFELRYEVCVCEREGGGESVRERDIDREGGRQRDIGAQALVKRLEQA